MNVDYFLDSDFLNCVFYFLSFGLVSWFMGWGVGFLAHLFIKITSK